MKEKQQPTTVIDENPHTQCFNCRIGIGGQYVLTHKENGKSRNEIRYRIEQTAYTYRGRVYCSQCYERISNGKRLNVHGFISDREINIVGRFFGIRVKRYSPTNITSNLLNRILICRTGSKTRCKYCEIKTECSKYFDRYC